MVERWAPIPDWPMYEISDHGRVRSWKPHHLHKQMGRRNQPLYRSAHKQVSGGYWAIRLKETFRCKVLRYKRLYIHRAVALAFVEGDKSLHVAHLDGDVDNNHYTNLAWCTPKENNGHKAAHGTLTEGENHASTALCDKGVRAVLKMVECGFSYQEIAYFFDVGISTINGYVCGRIRKKILKAKQEERAIKRQT